jgi:nitrous oxide reductase accessory protein NosL
MGWTAILYFAILTAGCGSASDDGAPRIVAGTPCAGCGMEARDLRWSAARRMDDRVRVYDSIECALRDESDAAASARETVLYLADFETSALHRSDSLWVVRADIPSPMGGGFAAFLDPKAAARIATERNGRVARFPDFAADRLSGATDVPASRTRP